MNSDTSQKPYTPSNYTEPIYAGFWRRFFAFIIDSIVITIVLSFVNVSVGYDIHHVTESGLKVDITINFAAIFIVMAYHAIFESSRLQATPGKYLLGIIVTDEHEQRIGIVRAIGRQLGHILSTLLFLSGYIMIAFTSRKQGLHDIAAGCLVICRPL